MHLTARVTAFIDVYWCMWGNALFNLCLFLTTYWISFDRSPNVCPLVNCLLWLPASIHRLFFLQLVKSGIHTIMNRDQRTHLRWKCIMTSEISMNMSYPSKRKSILSSLLQNYHVHLNINLVRLHLLSICAMLINIVYTLPISNQQRRKAFYFFCWRKLIEAVKTSGICKHFFMHWTFIFLAILFKHTDIERRLFKDIYWNLTLKIHVFVH